MPCRDDRENIRSRTQGTVETPWGGRIVVVEEGLGAHHDLIGMSEDCGQMYETIEVGMNETLTETLCIFLLRF